MLHGTHDTIRKQQEKSSKHGRPHSNMTTEHNKASTVFSLSINPNGTVSVRLQYEALYFGLVRNAGLWECQSDQ